MAEEKSNRFKACRVEAELLGEGRQEHNWKKVMKPVLSLCWKMNVLSTPSGRLSWVIS
ncbi:hypothetical protein [Listeria monocytogenes]|uniref:hypothetical protein n=1 Tax=Listeria monocytogenes TaxID=1639 RepID=UPI00350E3FB2